jgi:tripartite ATP-independent transporter DctM subunit
MIILLVIIFATCLVLRFPIAYAIAISCLIYVVLKGIPLIILPMKMYSGIDVFVLLSIPGFILAGNLMNHGGITEKIIDFFNHLFGHIRGGLSLANIGASMLFAGISGTAVSDTASIGSVMIPAMKKEGYKPDFSCAVTAASSTVGPIIPPSVPMIIAATLTGLSVGKLFLAGAVPGLMLGLGFLGVAFMISKKQPHVRRLRSSTRKIAKGFVDTFWALLMTFIILFGIIGGFFTPTEASIVAVVYAAIIGIFVYRKLSLKEIPAIVLESFKTSSSLMILVGFSNLLGWILVTERLPLMISESLLGFTSNKFLILILINLILLVVGTFMETIAALLILFPVLLNVATSVGVDPIQFAVIAVLNLIIGLTTPPVGVCLFVASSIGKISIDQVSRAILPFLFVSLIVLLLVTYFPQISLLLPGIFYE